MFEDRGSIWFGRGDEERLFYPFGIKSKGYSVAREQRRNISRWTQWRTQLPLVLAALYFLPLVGFFGPALSASGRLEAGTLAFSLIALVVATVASVWLVDRAAYAWLLRSCSTLDRFPTRSERQASSGQVTQSFANRNLAPLQVRLMCLAVGFATIVLGLVRGDGWLMLSGLPLAAVFAGSVLKDCCGQIHLWLLFDIAHIERGDRGAAT